MDGCVGCRNRINFDKSKILKFNIAIFQENQTMFIILIDSPIYRSSVILFPFSFGM